MRVWTLMVVPSSPGAGSSDIIGHPFGRQLARDLGATAE